MKVAETPLKYCFHYALVLYKRHCHSCNHGFHVINAWLVGSSSFFLLLSQIIIPRPVSSVLQKRAPKIFIFIFYLMKGSIKLEYLKRFFFLNNYNMLLTFISDNYSKTSLISSTKEGSLNFYFYFLFNGGLYQIGALKLFFEK